MTSSALTIIDLRWRGAVLFGNVVRDGQMLGIAWYRPGDFSCVVPELGDVEREWVLLTMREAYYRKI